MSYWNGSDPLGQRMVMMDGVDAGSGLTPKELVVMESLVKAWNEFIKLPDHLPNEKEEFAAALHQLQGILAVRGLLRAFPDYWR